MHEGHLASYSIRYGGTKIIEVLCDGLIVLSTWKYGEQLWARASRAQRKVHCCVLCGEETTIDDRLYRPISNSLNRMDRICEQCVGELGSEADIRVAAPVCKMGPL